MTTYFGDNSDPYSGMANLGDGKSHNDESKD